MAGTHGRRQRGRSPKRQAILILLYQFPEEIEADLLARGVDILDWYRGKVSSRRVLACVRGLAPTSAFRTAASDYDWPLDAQLMTGMWNEVKAMRSDLYALIDKQTMPFRPVLSPSAERAERADRAEMRALHDDLIRQLRGNN